MSTFLDAVVTLAYISVVALPSRRFVNMMVHKPDLGRTCPEISKTD
jgi:hypothetical protein